MINTELWNEIEENPAVENRYTGRLIAISSQKWRQHTNVYGKFWHSVSGFGAATTAAALEDGWMLYGLVRAVKPLLALEIGTHQGFSTCMIAAALRDNARGRLWTIDISNANLEAAGTNLDRFGLANMVRLWYGDAQKVLPELLENIGLNNDPASTAKLDFVFEDGSHEAETILAEMRILAPYLAPNAYLVFHDSILLDNVIYALTQLESIIGPCQRVTIGTCRGLDIWQRIVPDG